MKITKRDHDARVKRLADGTSPDPDDDRRLVKLYESTPQPVDEPAEQEQQAEQKPKIPQQRGRNARIG